MRPEQLKLLYEKLVVQATYPEDICPTEQKWAQIVTGALPLREQACIERHLGLCPECRKMQEQLNAASAWFYENEAHIYLGLQDKAVWSSVRPWDSCLAEDVLELYLQQGLPDTPAGIRLRRSIESHLDGCQRCGRTVERLKTYLAAPWFASFVDFAQQVDEKMRAALREVVEGLKVLASARGALIAVRAMPGFRSQPARTVSAILLDSKGKMILQEDGQPQRVEFCLIRAQLDRDGTLIVEVSMVDPQIQETQGHEFLLSVTIHHEHRRLIFPTESVPRHGHVIMVGHLVPGIQVEALPICAVRLTLYKVAKNPRRE